MSDTESNGLFILFDELVTFGHQLKVRKNDLMVVELNDKESIFENKGGKQEYPPYALFRSAKK